MEKTEDGLRGKWIFGLRLTLYTETRVSDWLRGELKVSANNWSKRWEATLRKDESKMRL